MCCFENMGLRNWLDKKQQEWEKNAEEKRAVEEEQEKFRGDLEELLDKFEMGNLKDFCKNYLGTEPTSEQVEDKKTGRTRKILPDRHTFVNFILDYFDKGELKAQQIQDFALKRKIVTPSFVNEESNEDKDKNDFQNIMNLIQAEFEAENINNETTLEDQLIIFLKAKYPGRQIERQQKTKMGNKLDILIDNKFVFELKVPETKTNLRNFSAQLEEYSEEYDYICTVIAELKTAELGEIIKQYTDKYRSKLHIQSIVKEVRMR